MRSDCSETEPGGPATRALRQGHVGRGPMTTSSGARHGERPRLAAAFFHGGGRARRRQPLLPSWLVWTVASCRAPFGARVGRALARLRRSDAQLARITLGGGAPARSLTCRRARCSHGDTLGALRASRRIDATRHQRWPGRPRRAMRDLLALAAAAARAKAAHGGSMVIATASMVPQRSEQSSRNVAGAPRRSSAAPLVASSARQHAARGQYWRTSPRAPNDRADATTQTSGRSHDARRSHRLSRSFDDRRGVSRSAHAGGAGHEAGADDEAESLHVVGHVRHEEPRRHLGRDGWPSRRRRPSPAAAAGRRRRRGGWAWRSTTFPSSGRVGGPTREPDHWRALRGSARRRRTRRLFSRMARQQLQPRERETRRSSSPRGLADEGRSPSSDSFGDVQPGGPRRRRAARQASRDRATRVRPATAADRRRRLLGRGRVLRLLRSLHALPAAPADARRPVGVLGGAGHVPGGWRRTVARARRIAQRPEALRLLRPCVFSCAGVPARGAARQDLLVHDSSAAAAASWICVASPPPSPSSLRSVRARRGGRPRWACRAASAGPPAGWRRPRHGRAASGCARRGAAARGRCAVEARALEGSFLGRRRCCSPELPVGGPPVCGARRGPRARGGARRLVPLPRRLQRPPVRLRAGRSRRTRSIEGGRLDWRRASIGTKPARARPHQRHDHARAGGARRRRRCRAVQLIRGR